ncbi:hypothetical protein TNCV_2180511 [Trichonephila clavipes]|uniref:Uncharacterized protein n=1 Tax=Trichonephila clavipes TaxID=2585209 RepID=A0A8X6VUR7_TRICX|nr:hypothetical protein TNCV_2180511 [Trichonephila clavipes]
MGAQILRNQYPKQPPMAVITSLIRLDTESNRYWMAFTGTYAHGTSTRCHSSSTVVTNVCKRASCSVTMDQTFSIGERSGERAGQRTTEHFPYQGRTRKVAARSIRATRVTCLFSQMLVIRGRRDPARLSLLSSRTHRFHILLTVIGSRPTRTAIMRYDKPHKPGYALIQPL